MSWRYLVGKHLSQMSHAALRMGMPGLRGRVYPFDLKRFHDVRRTTPQVIVDVGANVGQTCLSLRKWFPSATIFSIEPVRSTYEILVKNTRGYPLIRCRNLAFGDSEGTMPIRLMRNSELNTFADEPALDSESSGEIEEVRVTTLDEFRRVERVSRIDLLKIDTQGHEIKVLGGARESLGEVAFVLAEVDMQTDRADQTSFESLHTFLRGRGFCFCGLYEQYRHWDARLLVSFGNALYANTELLR